MLVKDQGEKKKVDAFEKQEVKFFRVAVGRVVGLPVERLCLIYGDKILNDHETLDGHKIKDGEMVILSRIDGPVKRNTLVSCLNINLKLASSLSETCLPIPNLYVGNN